jgi:ubiquitin C-terminal hydrolase
MIPEFRKGILESDVNDPDLENNVLYQMKLIFANLQESEK